MSDVRSATDRAEVLDAVEAYLVTGRFGEPDAITATIAAYYGGLGRLFEDVAGVPRGTFGPQDTPHLESLRRGLLTEALGRATRGDRSPVALDELWAILDAHSGDPSFDEDRARRAASAYGLTVLRAFADHPLGADVVDRFNASMVVESEDLRIDMVGADGDVDARIDAALRLVALAVPAIAPKVFEPVGGMVPFRSAGLRSAYMDGTPTVVYINVNQFDDPLVGADAVLHECLHQKMLDLCLSRGIVREGYVDDESARLFVPWGSDDRYLSVDRAISAFHVYAHLSLMHLRIVDGRGDLDRESRAADTERFAVLSWARAEYFARLLTTPHATAELGADGKAFIAWLDAAVVRLGEVTLPDGRHLRDRRGEVAVVGTAVDVDAAVQL